MKRNSVLGKGLSALISDIESDARGGFGDKEAGVIKLSSIGINPNQPRKIFKDNKIEELAHSIKQVGVLQPVLVRRLNGGEPKPVSLSERITGKASSEPENIRYCLVAGERRVRASVMAKLTEIPAIICSYQEAESLKVALLENIQRENLNPIEEAFAYQKLLDSYGATQEELSEMLGKSRSGIANTLRLLNLEIEIQELIQDEKITRGHAKVLLGVADQDYRLVLAKQCASKGMSVRDCEKKIIKGNAVKRVAKVKSRQTKEPSREIRQLCERAEQKLGSPVVIDRNSEGRGLLTIKFFTDEDLLRILEAMKIDTDLS
jgi:ParB family transcriptional regulator, chromosome partitioning protein